MRQVGITRPAGAIHAAIDLPRSKSVANRALVCASLAGEPSVVQHHGEAEDTLLLAQLLRERPRVMHCGLGGTTLRFLLAWACVQDGEERLVTGEPRLLERPHDDLVNALRSLGADIERSTDGYRVKGRPLAGGELRFDAPVSSQYISALMLVAPAMPQGLRIHWDGPRYSEPYVRMTAKVMAHFGVKVDLGHVIHVPHEAYMPVPIHLPPDWSAAAFWFEMAGLTGDADILLRGLAPNGWQGDEAVIDLTSELVAVRREADGMRLRSRKVVGKGPQRIDLAGTPDLFQPLACLFAGVEQPVTITGLGNLPHKETDRLKAMAEALASLGVQVDRNSDTFWIAPTLRGWHEPPLLQTHGDHRMAMALAPLALVTGRIVLRDPDVVNKSYPTFWDDLRKAGFGVEA